MKVEDCKFLRRVNFFSKTFFLFKFGVFKECHSCLLV